MVVDDIKVVTAADKIEIRQGDQTVSIGLGARLQDLVNALLTANYGLQQEGRMRKMREQREKLGK